MNTQRNENILQDLWIVDTDYSYDDQLALNLLITKAKLQIVAITVCAANTGVKPQIIKQKIETDLKNKYENSLIQVFAGADRPFIDYVKALKDEPIFDPYNLIKTDYTEISNACSAEFQNKTIENQIITKISNVAAVKISELVRLHGKKLNILTLGPLTNISLAVLIDSTIRDKFNNLFIVGGSYNNLGNSGNCAEYNFRVDPVAAKNTITYYKNITLLPLEIETQIQSKNIEGLLNNSFPEFSEALKLVQQQTEETRSYYSFLSFFSSIILLNLNQNIVKLQINRPCDIDIVSRFTRGALAIEKYDYLKSGKLNEISIVEEINVDNFYELFIKI